MFRLDQDIVITVNGQTARNTRPKPDLGFMLRNFLENRDGKLLYVAEI